MTKELPDPQTLRKLLRYDPETGKLFWLPRPLEMFSGTGYGGAMGEAARWNAKHSGREALRGLNHNGYPHGRLGGIGYLAHRIAWVIYYGFEPKGQIDHINGDRSDNRIANLRDVTNSQNARNSKIGSHNTSGYNAVNFDKRRGKWRSRLGFEGSSLHLGYFNCPTAAMLARVVAQSQYDFTERHGT